MRISSVRSPGRWGIRWVLSLVAVSILGLAAPAVSPAADESVVTDHERRIKELEDTIKQLKKDERQVEVNLENQKPLAGWSDGFNLASQDGKYKLRIGGYTQLDGRYFINDKNDVLTNQFLFRRARLDFSGTVFKYFDFRILPDFAGSQVILFDSYVDANFIPEVKFRVGKFKPPVGLERLQSATALMFVERGLPTNLVPNRDFGGQLFGDLVNGALTYQLAIVNGAPDNSNPTVGDNNDDKDFDGRIFAVPFKDTPLDLLKGLGFGLSGSYGRQHGSTGTPDLPTFKTFGQATFFSYSGAVAAVPADNTKTPPVPEKLGKTATFAFGQRERFSPQLFYYWGPVGLLGEYVTSAQTVRRDTVDASNKVTSSLSKTLSHDAWQLGVSYVITGESASYKGVVPARPFDPFADTWGAFEVAARYGQLEVDPDAFSQGFASATASARRDKEWVLGLNWYLNKNIKLVLDYGHTDFRGGAGSAKAIADRPAENAILSRVQLVL